jgi:hypothetical protein
MKKKTRKVKKPSRKQISASYSQCASELFEARSELNTQTRRADKFEKAYRALKDRLGQYLAIFAAGSAAYDKGRIQQLQEEMFCEPRTDSLSVTTYCGDFGNVTFHDPFLKNSGNYATGKNP